MIWKKRWGRRISFLLMIYMAVTLSIVTAFSPNYTVYMAVRAVNGLTFPALFQIPYILGNSVEALIPFCLVGLIGSWDPFELK